MMKKLLLLFIVLFFGGCVYGPDGEIREPTTQEREQILSALEEFPSTNKCTNILPSIKIAVARTHEEMFSLTGYCGPSSEETRGTDHEGDLWCRWGRVAGSYIQAKDGGVWPFALFHKEYPLLIVWHDITDAKLLKLVHHEALHWASECVTGDPDRDHTGEFWKN